MPFTIIQSATYSYPASVHVFSDLRASMKRVRSPEYGVPYLLETWSRLPRTKKGLLKVKERTNDEVSKASRQLQSWLPLPRGAGRFDSTAKAGGAEGTRQYEKEQEENGLVKKGAAIVQ